MASYTAEHDEQNPAAMFQSLDFITNLPRESTTSDAIIEELTRSRTGSTSSDRPSIPERIIVTEDGVVTAIQTIGFSEEERGRSALDFGARRYYARNGQRPVID